jgi:type IV pilus assembly protein PilQ
MKRVWSLAAPAALALTLGSPAAALALSHGVLHAAPVATAAPAAVAVRGISVVPAAGRAEVVIAVDGSVNVRDFTVDGPHRIVVDIEGARLGTPGTPYDRVARGGIRNVRLSQFNANVVRVVLDLDAAREYSVLNADGAIRVAVSGPADFAAWSSGGAAPAPATVAAAAAPAVDLGADLPAAPAQPRLFTATPSSAAFVPAAAATAQQPRQQQRITVTYENADIRDVLAGIAAMTGRTIVVGRDVTGEVSAEIRDQPWDVALQAILNSQGLAASEDASGIITVDSYANILARQSSEPLVTRLVQVNYVPAGSLTETVRSLLSRDCRAAAAAAAEPGQASGSGAQCAARGQVTADSATNSLLISEVPSRMGELLSYVRALDVRTPQVSIKGKLISVNRSATEQLGLSYDLGSAQGFSNRLAPRVDDEGTPVEGDFLVQLGGNALVGIANADRRYGQTSAISLIFSTMLGKFSLTSFLDALSEQRLSDVQAEPQATTLDNKKARIFVGQEVPVRTIDYGSAGAGGGLPRATVEFRQTGIILEVTPHITNNRHILMDVYAEQSELEIVGGDLGFFAPRRDVKTQVLVRDGETMALGGLTQTQVTKNRAGIPLLSSLPLIGRLFSQTETREDKQDLLILLTPRIVDDAGAGAAAPAPPR